MTIKQPATRDEGVVLPLILVITVVLGMVVLSIASYSTTSLRFGRVSENRSDRLAAADAGMRFAIDQIKLRNGCVFDSTVHVLPGITSDFNNATAQVSCQLVTSGLDDSLLFAVVVTGAGLAAGAPLLKTLGGVGSPLPKTLGGPVYLSRITNPAMDMSAPLIVENGMLYYHDATASCINMSQSTAIANADGYLTFKPALIYGPQCLNATWQQKFKSPWAPDLSALPARNGSISLLSNPLTGSFTDFTAPGLGTCRVFLPGSYTTPPDVLNNDSYFMSGNYLFDFPNANSTFSVQQSIATFGAINTAVASANQRPNSALCEQQQSLDTLNGFGATIYLAGRSHIEISPNGAMEIHARQQATKFVSVQALCNPISDTPWCRDPADPGRPIGFFGGDGNLGASKASTLTTATGSARALYTNSGNGKEFIAHAMFYTPLAKAEFGNATNTAEQKMLGGLYAGQVILQSSASATNFEIAVPTSPITGIIEVTSTAVKEGTTQIRAVLQFRYEEVNPDNRVRINSWRVCEGTC